MPEPAETYIVNDQPTENDALDFKPYVETLADIIETGDTPLTIGVFGTWGSGKTSLMRMVRNKLPKKFTVAWFDAWKYDKEETLWRAFLLSALLAVRSKVKKGEPVEDLDYLETMLYRAIDIEKSGGVTIDLAKLGGSIAQGAVQLGLGFVPGGAVLSEFVKKVQQLGAESLTDDVTDAIQRERSKIHIEQVRFLEQFQDKFRALVEQHITNNGGRLVVFVDDLDRCLPEKAIEVLEAIKLFLDAENCVFVLGLDQGIIARGIEMKYGELGEKQADDHLPHFTIEGIRYLEKIIQLPFQIPQIESQDMSDFVHGMSAAWPHEECPMIFAEGLGDNPRQIKRTVNVFLMLWNLAAKRRQKLRGRVKPIRLAKVVAIQAIHPDLYNLLLKEEPRYLRELEEYFRSESSRERGAEKGEVVAERAAAVARVEPPPALVPFLSQRGIAAVRRILLLHSTELQEANFTGLPTDELRLYFTLTARAEAPRAAPAVEATQVVLEPQVVRVPAGEFLMGSTKEQAAEAIKAGLDKDWAQYEQPQHTVGLSEYFVGKYPITNREYQAFIKDAKYNPPRGWDGDQFPSEKGGHPVVNVSWSDAETYCKWLSEKSGKHYRLPSEAEWEKAARGGDAQVYPWGNEFDRKRANTPEARIRDTSEVGQFSPQGDSPYGCADMAGNVWEWCADWFAEDTYQERAGQEGTDPQGPASGSARVVRGGSWNNDRTYARCACRSRHDPDSFPDLLGFRLVLSAG